MVKDYCETRGQTRRYNETLVMEKALTDWLDHIRTEIELGKSGLIRLPDIEEEQAVYMRKVTKQLQKEDTISHQQFGSRVTSRRPVYDMSKLSSMINDM